jgi:quinolinate synthase
LYQLEEVRKRVLKLKREHDAVIVAHNYQRPEVKDIADFVGDSLELVRLCTRVGAKTIVFCEVHFMT